MKPVATSIFVLSMLAPAASAQGGPGQAVEQLHLAIAQSDRAAAAAVLRLEGGAWQIVHLHWSSRRPMAR